MFTALRIGPSGSAARIARRHAPPTVGGRLCGSARHSQGGRRLRAARPQLPRGAPRLHARRLAGRGRAHPGEPARPPAGRPPRRPRPPDHRPRPRPRPDRAGAGGAAHRGRDRPAAGGPGLHDLHLRLDRPAEGGRGLPPDARQPAALAGGGPRPRGAGAHAAALLALLRRLVPRDLLGLVGRRHARPHQRGDAARCRGPAQSAGARADRTALPPLRRAAPAGGGRGGLGDRAGAPPARRDHRRRAAPGHPRRAALVCRPARLPPAQPLRPVGEPRGDRARAARGPRRLAGPAADRPADRQRAHPPRLAAARARPGRRRGRIVDRRAGLRRRLSRPAGRDGGEIRPRSVERSPRRPPLPHRRPGAPSRRRRDRVPRTRRRAGEDPRLPRRARRGGDGGGGAPRGARRGGAGARRPRRRARPGRPRGARAG